LKRVTVVCFALRPEEPSSWGEGPTDRATAKNVDVIDGERLPNPADAGHGREEMAVGVEGFDSVVVHVDGIDEVEPGPDGSE
jgi:hypothetical protein